jgi:hypothetical protein
MYKKFLGLWMAALLVSLSFVFMACPTDSGGSASFTAVTNSATQNNAATLGFVGTSVGSEDTAVATAGITEGRIAITSVGPGTTTVWVTADGYSNATIPVTVGEYGAITLGTITKGVPVQDNRDILNDEATLGFIGTSAESDDNAVATAKVGDFQGTSRIVITPKGEGDATISVKLAGYSDATIEVTVNANLILTIGKITKGEKIDFIATTNQDTANNEATLGFVGTSAVSDDDTVATAGIPDGSKIVITSVGAGTTTIRVRKEDYSEATIPVTVAENGEITLGDITKGAFNPPAFIRPQSAASYTLVKYEGKVATLRGSDGTEVVRSIPDSEPKFQNLFRAIYEPNKPDSTDSIESGKSVIPYTEVISRTALALFTIVIEENSVKVEIKGTTLPNATGASVFNLIVIDIGIPDENNSDLPTFYIPDRELGFVSGNYAHLRLRVNNGASRAILADNSSYIASGAGHSCPDGYFNGGAVEVMAGGKLRDGAYEGFPLGSNAVILNRSGSYLAVGPESSFTYTAGTDPERDQWYSGFRLAAWTSG